jgi:hypothetical protein
VHAPPTCDIAVAYVRVPVTLGSTFETVRTGPTSAAASRASSYAELSSKHIRTPASISAQAAATMTGPCAGSQQLRTMVELQSIAASIGVRGSPRRWCTGRVSSNSCIPRNSGPLSMESYRAAISQ